MMPYGLGEAIIVVVVWLFVLALAAALIYGIWLLYKTLKKLDRLETELNAVLEELRLLRGVSPSNP